MSHQSDILIAKRPVVTMIQPNSISSSYDDLLNTHKLDKQPNGFYWQVGNIERTQGWILHLSVVRHQLYDLLRAVLPFLLEIKVPFKIPYSMAAATIIGDGGAGYINLSKMVSIYPSDDIEAIIVAKALIERTKSFSGPNIPTDINLGAIVYTRYGSFDPILMKDSRDHIHKYIYDPKGELIEDPYNIPFILPAGIKWPFAEFTTPNLPVRPKLLNFKYYRASTIKADAKGHVVKGVYFEKPWKISACIIKEGRKSMFSDAHGRDIRDRLQWQYELHQKLHHQIPIPRLIDYFQQNDESFLILEFCKGIPINEWAFNQYNLKIWRDLPDAKHVHILKLLVDLIRIIEKLHNMGYIHRDLTSGNILIDKNGKINLIDLELMWSMSENKPNPLFKLGTHGFMSPEQILTESPTVEQDIYAIGAVLMNVFTNLNPVQVYSTLFTDIEPLIMFLTGNAPIAKLVASCVDKNPDRRPALSVIRDALKIHMDPSTRKQRQNEKISQLINQDMKPILTAAISGMAHVDFLNEEGCWVSTESREDQHIVNEQHDITVKVGWQTGLSGPLWLLSKLKVAGYSVDAALSPFEKSWQYLQNYIAFRKDEQSPGLYSGNAGIALALSENLYSGLLSPDAANIDFLKACFAEETPLGGLRFGLAGQGLALLSAKPWIGSREYEAWLNQYISKFLSAQSSDGSWPFFEKSDKKHILAGISRGVAGAAWFLLACMAFNKDPDLQFAINRALHWLSRRPLTNLIIPRNSKKRPSMESLNTSHGTIGIVLTYIKAYEILGNNDYKKIAEKYLEQLPERFLMADFSFFNGLSGLGELYLEAARALQDDRWAQRAAWLAEFFVCNMQRKKEKEGFWVTGDFHNITMDLFTGNSGIIHFLLRFTAPDSISHPFWPSLTN